MFSFSHRDPTLFNLLSPFGGISNWLALPGALVGGTLVELFGASALWVPTLAIVRIISRQHRLGAAAFFFLTLMAVIFSATMHGLVAVEPGLGLGKAGIIGVSGGRWLVISSGPWMGGLLVSWGLGYALVWLLTPAWSTALWTDMQLVFRYLSGRSRAMVGHGIAIITAGFRALAEEMRFLFRHGPQGLWVRLRATSTVGPGGRSGGLSRWLGRRGLSRRLLRGDWTASDIRKASIKDDGFDHWVTGLRDWNQETEESGSMPPRKPRDQSS